MITLEAVIALGVGVAALWLVLRPLLNPASARALPTEPLDPEETPKGVALAALKEIEFDRETGKLSDDDYELLKAKYTVAALEALRSEQAGVASDDIETLIAARVRSLRSASVTKPSDTGSLVCRTCGPRPEADAIFCSSCGLRLVRSQESGNTAQSPPDS